MARRAGSRAAATRATARSSWRTVLLVCAAAAATALVAVASRRRGPAAAASAAPPLPLAPFRPDLPLLSVGRPLPPRPSEPECQELLRRYVEDHPAVPVPYRRPDGEAAAAGATTGAAATTATTPAPRLFFLHIPRTAGRTVHYCLLVQGTHPRWRCPRAYAGVSLGQGGSGSNQDADAASAPPPPPPLAASARRCHLLSSHDDFSLAQALANDSSSDSLYSSGVAAVTQLRDPVQRVLSAYEFVVTHALNLAKLSEEEERQLDALGAEQGRLDTFVTRVWPWSELIPVVVRDVRERQARLGLLGQAGQQLGAGAGGGQQEGQQGPSPGGDGGGGERGAAPPRSFPQRNPYDSPDVAMPLAEFLRLPLARDLLFEGQAMQVLGLTANSRWQPGADALRACALRPPPTTEQQQQQHQSEEGTAASGPFSAPSFSSTSTAATANATASSWPVRDALLSIALARLSAFAHVGVSERVRESAESAAAALGMDLAKGPAYGRQGNALDYDDEDDDEEEEEGLGLEQGGAEGLARAVEEEEARRRAAAAAAATAPAARRQKTPRPGAVVGQVQPLPLGQAFLRCAARYREADKRAGRVAAESVPVPPGAPPMRAFGGNSGGAAAAPAPAAATSAARGALVPPELLAWLAEQNGMDTRLHALASESLDAARERWRSGGTGGGRGLQPLSAVEEARAMRLAAAAAGDGPALKATEGGPVGEEKQQQKQQVVV